MNADLPNEGDSFFSKNLAGLPADQLTPSQNLVAAFDDLLDLVRNTESAVFVSEGKQKGFFHAGKKRADRYWRSPKPCVFPGCTRQSIPASHTLQRAGPLSLVAENQHVLAPMFDRSQGRIVIQPLGIGEASTFPGFCQEHEQLFADFEATGRLAKPEDVALQVFRSICREIVHKRACIWQLEHFIKAYDVVLHERGLQFLQARLDPEMFRQLHVQMLSISIKEGSERKASTMRAIETARKFLQQIEQDFLVPSHREVVGGQAGLFHLTIRIEQVLPVCLAGTATFGVRDSGQEKDVRVFVNVWPAADETVITIASPLNQKVYLECYIGEFAKRPLGALTMVETWMVRGTDQWFIRPSVWNALPGTRQERILADLVDTRYNIGEPYHASVFDEVRRCELASADGTPFSPATLEVESQKLLMDR